MYYIANYMIFPSKIDQVDETCILNMYYFYFFQICKINQTDSIIISCISRLLDSGLVVYLNLDAIIKCH